MDAFVEILSGLIRIGPDCHRYNDPYELDVTFSANKGFATLKGLVVPKDRIIHPDGRIIVRSRYSRREAREIYDIVHLRCRELGLEPIFERVRKP